MPNVFGRGVFYSIKKEGTPESFQAQDREIDNLEPRAEAALDLDRDASIHAVAATEVGRGGRIATGRLRGEVSSETPRQVIELLR